LKHTYYKYWPKNQKPEVTSNHFSVNACLFSDLIIFIIKTLKILDLLHFIYE
jgi:hypothetical protein